MTEAQFERLLIVLERIADSLSKINASLDILAGAVDELTNQDGSTTSVLNIWKEGENE